MTASGAPATGNWFLGLVVPPAAGWHRILEGLPEDLPEGLRRFAPEDLHLTVAFLGPCGPEPAERAWRALASLTHPPLTVTASGWRALGPRRRPSAYGLTLGAGREAVADLLTDWGSRALAAAGLPVDRRRPLPHVTLARPPRAGAETLRAPMAAWMASAPLPERPLLLERIALYSWDPAHRSRLFRIVAERPLDPPESAQSPGARP